MERREVTGPAGWLARLSADMFGGRPHLAVDPAWLEAAVNRLPVPDRALVRRVGEGDDLDRLARAQGLSRRGFDARWASLAGELARRARDEHALRRGEVGDPERSIARAVAAFLRERGWDVSARAASIAALAPDHRRFAIEAVGVGPWALEAAVGEAVARAAAHAGVLAGIATDDRAERGLRAQVGNRPDLVPPDLAIYIVEGAFVRETSAERLAAPRAPLPRGPFAGRS